MYGDLMTHLTLQQQRERALARELSHKRIEMRPPVTHRVLSRLWAFLRRPSALERKRVELGRIPLFAELPRQRFDLLARSAEVLDVPAGRELIREGDLGHEFFAISAGEVEISKWGRRVATERAGDVFGEIALLRGIPRTATVRTLVPSRLFVLHERVFHSLIASSFS
jgi:CRP-like cAMP-binding protein